MSQLYLLFNTVRYLKSRQILGRLLKPMRGKIKEYSLPASPSFPHGKLPASVAFPEHDSKNTGTDIWQGTFSFLNDVRALGRPVDWHPDAPLLWRFNLHYFNYLHCLDVDEQRTLCREWMVENPVGKQPGWHPYPTSLRIINWCKAGFEAPDLLRSLYQQAAYLYRHLETHLLGNHLLENARALVFAGSFFGEQGEAPDWLQRGLDVYREQTPEQILEDGGHFERSPMYHAIMLEGYLDMLNLLPATHPDRPWLEDAARRMVDFLAALTHPDGKITLFNDASFGIAPAVPALLGYARRVLNYEAQPKTCFSASGYFVHDSEELYCVVDAGPIGPDYIPGHAHADIFNYEVSLGKQRWIVDTGVYQYESGSMRDYVRSTQAHNTVTIDGVDQAECWDAFRVARRFPPVDVVWEQQEANASLQGRFEGYGTLIGDQLVHERRMDIDSNRRVINVSDRVTGRGTHRVESRVQFHPDVEVSSFDATRLQLRCGERKATLSVEGGNIRIEQGWYCPEFGIRRRTQVAVIWVHETMPAACAYTFRY
jgi:uncharacterized heparinase superfamily protein